MGVRRLGLPVAGLALALALALAPAGSVGPAGADDPQGRPLEQRPLLLILLTDPQHPAPAHSPGYYERLVTAADPSIAGYYRAQSQGRFTYTEAGRVSVTDTGEPGPGRQERALMLAARSGYAFAAHDTDRNGTLTGAELTVLVVDNLSEGEGMTRKVCRRLPGRADPGVRYCSNVASVGHRSSLQNYVHELAHTLTPPAVDLYGPAHRCLSRGLTLMSCTAGAADDPDRLMALDPIHRREYGWLPSEPVHRPGSSRSYVLQPAGSGPAQPLTSDGSTVTYPRPGGAERMTFEVRSPSPFDTRLPDSGLYVWYDAGTFPPSWTPSLSTPGELDPAAFVLSPDHCVLTPTSRTGRGRGTPIGPGTYRLQWLDGRDSGTLLTVRPADRAGRVRLDLHPSRAAPTCDS